MNHVTCGVSGLLVDATLSISGSLMHTQSVTLTEIARYYGSGYRVCLALSLFPNNVNLLKGAALLVSWL